MLALTASVVGEMLAAQYGLGFYNLMSRLEKRLLHWRGESLTV